MTFHFNPNAPFEIFIKYFWEARKVKGQDIIVQYPMLSFDKEFSYLQLLSKYNNLYYIIHDIQSMRRGDELGIEYEISLLNLAKGVIVHNRFMEMKLLEYGLSVDKIYRINILRIKYF